MHASETIALACQHGSTLADCSICLSVLPLKARLDDLLEEARPRLLRLASLHKIAADEADDVVQETYVEAWKHLENLREPERFASWLDGICRNVCKRHIHAQASNLLISALPVDENDHGAATFDVCDPLAIDPSEELEHYDMQVLLDRALSYLSEDARELIELCYLAERPQREVAQRLHMSLGALEVKLHRTRRQLRQILNSDLRADAAEFGLLLNEDEAMGWQETRQWCWICGKERLRGTFERQPSGIVALRLRCPSCSTSPKIDISNTGNWDFLGNMRSFRPAIKRMFQACSDFYGTALNKGHCNICQSPVQLHVLDRDTACNYDDIYHPLLPMVHVLVDCPRCGGFLTIVITTHLNNTLVHNFLLNHPRVLCEPDALTAYAGQDAIRSRVSDLNSGERLTIMTHPETLQVMAIISE